MKSMPTDNVAFDGQDIIDDYIAKYSNWGRWGDDDEVGALNHVGPKQIRDAASLVRDGKVISMALPFDSNGPQPGNGMRINPMNLVIASGTDYISGAQEVLPANLGLAKGFGYADDTIVTPNQAGTQWDSLAHIFWRGHMYNGRDAADVTLGGAKYNSITAVKDRLVMRAVLLDVARHKKVDVLEPGYAITVEDLENTATAQGVTIESGDAVVIRTGMLENRRGNWGDYAGGAAPGLSVHTAPWLYKHNIAAVASDTWGVEVRPNELDIAQPLHIVALVHMGVLFGEIWDLHAISDDCAADGRYDFMLSASPLPVTGAVGSMINPVAIK